MELVRMLEKQERSHGTAEREALHSYLVGDDIREALEVLRPGDEILHRSLGKVPEILVGTGTAVVTRHAGIGRDGNDAVLAPPLVGGVGSDPALADIGGVGAAVDLEMHRIFLGRVEIEGIGDHCRDFQSVIGGNVNHPGQGVSGGIETRSGHVGYFECGGGVAVAQPPSAALCAGKGLAGAPRQGGPVRFIQPYLRRRGEIGQGGDEPAPVRREAHPGDIVLRVSQGRYDTLAVHLVKGGLGGKVPVGREVHVPGLLVHTHNGSPPVLSVSKTPELRPVVGQIVYLLPSGLESPDHVKSVLSEAHLLRPVQPGRVFLVVDMLPGPVGRIDAEKVQFMLETGLPGDEETTAVGAPERDPEILVFLLVEIRPHYITRSKIDYAYTDLGIGLSCLGIACPVQRTVLAERRVDRKHGHSGVVEAVESYLPGVRRPPESAVHRRTAEDLLIIYPGRETVQYQVRAIIGQPRLPAGSDVHDP